MEGERAVKLFLPPSSVLRLVPAAACPWLCGYTPVPAFWYRNARADLRSGAVERPVPTRASLWYVAARAALKTESPDVLLPAPS